MADTTVIPALSYPSPHEAWSGVGLTPTHSSAGSSVRRTTGATTTAQSAKQGDERNAIIHQLHDERRRLERRRRTDGLSHNEAAYLHDISSYIDRLEQEEETATQPPQNDPWARLDRLATELLAVQDSINELKR